jgi:signal transduction histidine kinase
MSDSLHAHLLAVQPHLPRTSVSKPAMRILSRLVEDRTAASGPGAILITGFQDLHHWVAEQDRYRQLSRTARVTAVHASGGAGHATPPGTDPAPLVIGVERTSPLAEEWFLAAMGEDLSVVLCARDLRPDTTRDSERRFDAVISTDPAIVSSALAFLADALDGQLPHDEDTPWPHVGRRPRARPNPARLAQQNDELLAGLLGQIELLRHQELLARHAADRAQAQALSAAAAERRRLAQALHDESLQYLLAAHQDLQEHSTSAAADDPDLRRARSNLEHGLTHLRGALGALQPHRPPVGDLDEALHLMAAELGARGGFTTTISISPTARERDRARLFLPIVRELLVNTAKHARAATVRIAITAEHRRLHLHYADDGTGFTDADARAARHGGHLGLAILDDRLRSAGGSLHRTSTPGAGTAYHAEIPDHDPDTQAPRE